MISFVNRKTWSISKQAHHFAMVEELGAHLVARVIHPSNRKGFNRQKQNYQ